MCGIAGVVDWKADLASARPVVAAMAATLACRGPDADDIWISGHAALAHRRLIVVDPAGGAQPMLWQEGDRTWCITYNGELYNTPEIRQDLLDRGFRFRSHSDTEVLLAAYVAWGPECLGRLNGIFAFAIWSDAEQKLFLARDRLGVKPLFYAQRGNTFLFGSELKALLAHPAVTPAVDAEGLAEVLVIGPNRTPGHGVFRGVQELKPGHCLELTPAGPVVRRYWQLASHPHEDDLDTTIARVRELLGDAARRQLVSDVPVCTLLSGGLDSSALTAFAAQAYRSGGLGPLRTYSVDFAGNESHFRPDAFQPGSDAPWVQRMAAHLGTHHHAVTIDTDELVTALDVAVRARDLPGMADVDASLYLFCREIKRGATVALSGECADEVFGGYPWFYRPEARGDGTFPWSRRLNTRLELFCPDLVDYLRPVDYMARRYQEALAEVPRLPGEDLAEAQMREMFYLNLTRWMPVLLDRKDRMSMVVGLEVRVPFCDHRLVEYVWNVPWSMKFAGGREKGLLRLALADVLPPDVLERRKSPYPKTHHPAYLAAVRDRLLAVLDGGTSPLLPLVNQDALRALAATAAAATLPPWFGQLMGGAQLFAHLLQVDTWLREYQVQIG